MLLKCFRLVSDNYCRWLKIFDLSNFSSEQVENYYSDAVHYIFQKYSKSLEDNYVHPVEESKEEVKEDSTLPGADDIDEHTMMLYQQLQENDVIMEIESETKNFDMKMNELNDRITLTMKKYREECSNMNMIAWLDEHGNEAYRTEKEKNPSLLNTKIGRYLDASYTANFFDVIKWWKLVGENKFKELSAVAAMFLGRPMHNGFQERVFSRGTYSDTKLKKRLKEQNFEMSVLNAFNGRKLDDIKEKLRREPDWRYETENNMCVPNVEQAKEVISFFKDSTTNDIVEEVMIEKISNDDDTVSIGSEIQNINDDDDDTSLEDFLHSKEFLEEKDVEQVEVVSVDT